MRSGNIAGIIWMLISGAFFVAVTVIVRYLGSNLPAVEAAFIRYAFGLLLITPVLLRMRSGFIARSTMKLYVARGLLHGAGVMLWFFAMARIPVADVVAVGLAAPLFIIAGAAIFLKEDLPKSKILAMIVGFVGVLVIVRPGFQVVDIGMVAQLLAAPFFAGSFLLAKKLTDTQSPVEVVVMLSISCTLVLLPGALWQWRTPTGSELFWMFLPAVCATAGHNALTRALRAAPVTVTQPVTFLQLIWATIIGALMFGEPADFYVFLGSAIIVAVACFTSHHDLRLPRVRSFRPKV